MNKLIPVLALMTSTAWAGSLDNSCAIQPCAPGDKAVTYATQSEMYWACPTRELAERHRRGAGRAVLFAIA